MVDAYEKISEEPLNNHKCIVRDYASELKRPFTVRHNALTQTIEVLDSKDKIMRFANNVKGDLSRLIAAFEKGLK